MTNNTVDNVQKEEKFTENPDGAKQGDPLLEFFDITLTGYGDDSTVGVFHLFDGLEDTNHLYRQNVKWKKLEDNYTTFINIHKSL